ncbi:MAG: glycosyltransferase [Bauldia sp.]|nr:glycosyltransferase [Bauldia sp.]
MVTARPEIAVLCSTYNGAAYLPRMVESIDSQTHQPSVIVFRDDGSDDATVAWLERLASARSNVVVDRGRHIGINESFFSLLRDHGHRADYVAFADQDDFWLSSKLARAAEALAGVDDDRPALWCSRLMIADAALQPLQPTMPINRPSLGNALVENIAAGCTIVLNRAAVRLLSDPPLSSVLYYDWWCYLACSALGSVIVEAKPSVLYRQHTANSVGVVPGGSKALAAKIKRQSPGRLLSGMRNQALGFLGRYGEQLEDEKRALATRFADRDRSLAFDRRIFRQQRIDDTLLRAALLVGL